jgi:hypothetical protein
MVINTVLRDKSHQLVQGIELAVIAKPSVKRYRNCLQSAILLEGEIDRHLWSFKLCEGSPLEGWNHGAEDRAETKVGGMFADRHVK